MNLIVDIGNSSTKAAVFNGDTIVLREHLEKDVINGLSEIAADFDIRACAFSSVGESDSDVVRALRRISSYTLQVTGLTPTPLICDYATPETLGADRLAAAVGAYTCCPDRHLLIIDVGTCITYDYVSNDRHYLGGNISLGLGMRFRALHDQTALLPLVTPEGEVPEIGKDTFAAIRAGVINGIESEIKGYIRSFLYNHPDGHIFMTGGNGFRFVKELEIERNNTLVEIGLNRILTHNM